MNKPLKFQRLWHPWRAYIRHCSCPAVYQPTSRWTAGTEYSKLQNGLTIVTESRFYTPYVCAGLYIDAGSRYEEQFENGIAHFFEHLVYKRSKTRNRIDMFKALTATGANFGCFTTREMICFYVQCLREQLTLTFDLLCDCVFNNALADVEIKHQRSEVYYEMIRYEEDTNAMLFDYLHSAAFQGTPLAQTVMGPSSNLCNFNSCTIDRYLCKFFDPCRTVLAAVGSVRHAEMAMMAKCHLDHLVIRNVKEMRPYRYTGSDVRFRDDSMPLANVVIAVEGPSWCHEDNLVMEVARCAVGGWDRSQVSGNIIPTNIARYASDLRLCDAYKAFNINYKDTGLWGVQFLCDVMSIDDMCNLIQGEWMYLCNCITNSEVERAKNFFTTQIFSKMHSATNACHDLGRWVLYTGCQPTPSEKLAALDRVYAERVREVCYKYLYDKCPTVAAMGRIEGLMEYQRIRSGMFWLRV